MLTFLQNRGEMVVATCPIWKEGIWALGSPFQPVVLLYHDDSHGH